VRIILTLVLLLACSSGWAKDDEAELKALQQDIKKLQAWLKNARDEYSELDQALQQSDEDIAELTRRIEATRQQLKEERDTLKKLRQEQGQLRHIQQQHRQHLSEQLRAAARRGNTAPLKVLLNQDDPQQSQRLLRYFQSFNQARSERIEHLIAELQRLATIDQQVQAQQQQLQQTERQLQQKNASLKTKRQQQQTLLASLKRDMSNERQRLKRKEADRQRLEQLLREVEFLLANTNRQQDEQPFRSMKGKLPMPVDAARVLEAFGSLNPETKARRRGWLMSSAEGKPVIAVHHGRIVFSDWLRGYGLVSIVDHGDGYLSLYANNQALFHDVGSWVYRGDVLARSGRNSASEDPSLYFELRYKGKAQDPAAWLKRR
jgi:septal ring factor EnvC (AmiA/AmiB activator)